MAKYLIDDFKNKAEAFFRQTVQYAPHTSASGVLKSDFELYKFTISRAKRREEDFIVYCSEEILKNSSAAISGSTYFISIFHPYYSLMRHRTDKEVGKECEISTYDQNYSRDMYKIVRIQGILEEKVLFFGKNCSVRILGVESTVKELDGIGLMEGKVIEISQIARIKYEKDFSMFPIIRNMSELQETAMRTDVKGILVLEGPGGTGKTSVAIYRMGYLLQGEEIGRAHV